MGSTSGTWEIWDDSLRSTCLIISVSERNLLFSVRDLIISVNGVNFPDSEVASIQNSLLQDSNEVARVVLEGPGRNLAQLDFLSRSPFPSVPFLF